MKRDDACTGLRGRLNARLPKHSAFGDLMEMEARLGVYILAVILGGLALGYGLAALLGWLL